MKKALFLISLVGIIFLAGCGMSKTPSIPMVVFDATGYSIQYPETREAQPKVLHTLAIFFTPQETGDKIREFVGINSVVLPSDMSVDNYYTTIAKPQYSLTIQDFKEVSNENIVLNDLPAKKIVYKGTQFNMPLERMQLLVIKNKTVYMVTYTAMQSTFDTFAQEADAMFDTLIIK